MEVLIAIILSLATGLTIGHILGIRRYHKDPIGTLRVDSSDPDGPYLFLELETDPSVIIAEKSVLLKVNTKPYYTKLTDDTAKATSYISHQ